MLTEVEKAYIAGFLDGDGCIMFQLIRRKDYIYGFQVRASIVFFQKTVHRAHLESLKEKLYYGYIRNRPDGMSEYTIVGLQAVRETLDQIAQYVQLKKPHAELAYQILDALPKHITKQQLLVVAELVDKFKELNYSKRRVNNTAVLKIFLEQTQQSCLPVTTDS